MNNQTPYQIHDVLRITRNGQEALARIARDIEPNKPMYVNLRRAGDYGGWRQSVVKINVRQIIEYLPNWEKEREAQYEAELKARCDERWAKMSPAQRRNIHIEAVRLGIAQEDRRSPTDIMIDRACGLE